MQFPPLPSSPPSKPPSPPTEIAGQAFPMEGAFTAFKPLIVDLAFFPLFHIRPIYGPSMDLIPLFSHSVYPPLNPLQGGEGIMNVVRPR